jgi:hypothetical protein
MPLDTMYDLVAGSPEVALVDDIDDSQLTFDITAGSGLVPPMLITICDRTHFETMLATDYTGATVTVAARSRQGTARAWSSGSVVLVAWTEEHYATLKANMIKAAKSAGSKLYLAATVGAM